MKIMVRKRRTPKERTKITVILDLQEAQRFSSYCEERGFKKSTLIARLVREYLDAQGQSAQPTMPRVKENS